MRFGFQLTLVAVTLAWAIPANAATVPVTFNPNGFLYSYWINGTGGGSAANTSFAWNATVGETYTVRTRGNTVTVGTFSVDAGGNITESAAGLATPSAGAVRFDNSNITFNPGTFAYPYYLDWLVGPVSGTYTTPMPKGSGDWLMYGNSYGVADNVVNYSIDNSGNMVISSSASGGIYTASGSTLKFPTPISVFIDAPASLAAYTGDQHWGVFGITASFGADNFADQTVSLIPGTLPLLTTNLPAGTWLTGTLFDLPAGDFGWSQTLTYQVTADGSLHTFTFYAPEPASAGLLAVGMLSLLRRRRIAA